MPVRLAGRFAMAATTISTFGVIRQVTDMSLLHGPQSREVITTPVPVLGGMLLKSVAVAAQTSIFKQYVNKFTLHAKSSIQTAQPVSIVSLGSINIRNNSMGSFTSNAYQRSLSCSNCRAASRRGVWGVGLVVREKHHPNRDDC